MRSMTTSFRARFENGKLIPKEPVDLPLGADLEVYVRAASTGEPAPEAGSFTGLAKLARKLEQYPPNPESPG